MNYGMLELVGRSGALLQTDINNNEKLLVERVASSRFLVIGAAGSIGQAVTKEIFKRKRHS